MRSKVFRTLTLALLLCSAGVAQQPGAVGKKGKEIKKGGGDTKSLPQIKQLNPKGQAEKSQLEDILGEAMRNNPDIRVVAAKLAEAEAKLIRARVQVTQKVVALYQEILSQRAIVDVAQRKYDRVTTSEASGKSEPEKVEQAGVDLTLAKAKLEELEAQMTGLLGKAANAGTEQQSSVRESNRDQAAANRSKPEGPVVERIRKALQTPVKVDYKDMTFDQILQDLAKKVEGLSFRRNPYEKPNSSKHTLSFEEALPVSAILQALSDESGYFFFVRQYGISVRRNGAPPGAMTIEEFLRHKPGTE